MAGGRHEMFSLGRSSEDDNLSIQPTTLGMQVTIDSCTWTECPVPSLARLSDSTIQDSSSLCFLGTFERSSSIQT